MTALSDPRFAKPGEVIAAAKAKAKTAFDQGSSRGLTTLEKSFYEIFQAHANELHRHSRSVANQPGKNQNSGNIYLDRKRKDVRVYQSHELPRHRSFLPRQHNLKRVG